MAVIANLVGHRNLVTTQGYMHTADDKLPKVVADLGNIVSAKFYVKNIGAKVTESSIEG